VRKRRGSGQDHHGRGKFLVAVTLPASPITMPVTAAGVTVREEVYPFAATVPVESNYAITSGSLSPYVVSRTAFVKGVDLSC
jgi:hypothetical protein